MAAHKRRVHGDDPVYGDRSQTGTVDETQHSFLRGELGAIADISAESPLRAIELRANYLKSETPLLPRRVLQHRDPISGRWHNIHTQPIMPEED